MTCWISQLYLHRFSTLNIRNIFILFIAVQREISAMRYCTWRRTLYLVLAWGLIILIVLYFCSTRSLSYLVDSRFRPRRVSPQPVRAMASYASTRNDKRTLLQQEIANTHKHSEDIVQYIQNQNPRLPFVYWDSHKNKKMHYRNSTCAVYPNIFDLDFHNIYWQTLRTTNEIFQLYGAYYDIRDLSTVGPSVRLLGMINKIDPSVQTCCQLWFENLKEPVFVKVEKYMYVWNKGFGIYKRAIYHPYLITCPIPEDYQTTIPASVSLVERCCDKASNNLRVIYNKPEQKKDFAVCVKGLDFLHVDISVSLIEWIELLGILGADKIFFHELHVHPNISKVLRHYEASGRIEVTRFTHPDGPNVPGLQHIFMYKNIQKKRLNELITYNDCLYRNIYSYRYLALLDIDEIIIPINKNSWKDLMDDIEVKAQASRKVPRSSYHFRHVDFPDAHEEYGFFKDIPLYNTRLQRVYRSKDHTRPGASIKCFHDTGRVVTVHNHFPISCFGTCSSYSVDPSDAHLQHYCGRNLTACFNKYRGKMVLDTSIWKFKEKLIKHTTKTLTYLGFINADESALQKETVVS